MTSQKWQAMSAEQRRVWIAERCGWAWFQSPYDDTRNQWAFSGIVRGDAEHGDAREECLNTVDEYGDFVPVVPDYERDLNACAEMVATRNSRTRSNYRARLYVVCGGQAKAVDATAQQRCEAFALAVEPETGE